jgi:hypothetical protein
MRAFFANGVDKMHIPWAVEGLPTLLHLSLFLFFGGLVIFLFNVDREVFTCVVWWIGFFSAVYGLITLLPLIRPDSPYYAPLSVPAWFLYASIPYLFYRVYASITNRGMGNGPPWSRRITLRNRYRDWMSKGVEMKAEEMAEEQSEEIDFRILDWTISALGDDDSLEKFLEAIPGFFDSKVSRVWEGNTSWDLNRRICNAWEGFLDRALSSKSVIYPVKIRRLDISMNVAEAIHCPPRTILTQIIYGRWDQLRLAIELGQYLARWCVKDRSNTAEDAQTLVARVLTDVRERDDRWVGVAAMLSGLPEQDLRDHIAYGGDTVILAILTQVIRQYMRSNSYYYQNMIFAIFIRECSMNSVSYGMKLS